MSLTNSELSVWELGHRLAAEDPDRWRPFGPPLAVKDALRMLMNEIHEAHLESSLLMEKWQQGSEIPPDMYIRRHLPKIESCVNHRRCNRRFLEFVTIQRWDFYQWCRQSGYRFPPFWFETEYRWPDDSEEEAKDGGDKATTEPTADHPDRLNQRQRAKVACREIAKALWKDNPDMTIPEMARRDEIQKLGGGAHYKESTVKNWIRDAAPPEVKGRRGRPPKDDKDKS